MKILYFFLFFGVTFALQDPDPDPTAQINADPCGSGSGYGSGSETLPPPPQPKGEGTQSPAGEGEWGVPIRTTRRITLVYSVYSVVSKAFPARKLFLKIAY
jgi:hypothetical protein